MAELMMLNKEISAGKSSLIQQNSVYSSGKENRKTEDGGNTPLDFSKVLRASKEEGEKKEGKDEILDYIEQINRTLE